MIGRGIGPEHVIGQIRSYQRRAEQDPVDRALARRLPIARALEAFICPAGEPRRDLLARSTAGSRWVSTPADVKEAARLLSELA